MLPALRSEDIFEIMKKMSEYSKFHPKLATALSTIGIECQINIFTVFPESGKQQL